VTPAELAAAVELEACGPDGPPVDQAGRYRFPMLADDRVRVVADCSCGWTMDGPERVWNWLSDRHAHAHSKGIDGLSAAAVWNVRHIAAEQPEPEPEAEAGL
jgi:hypothetical protein